jgi:hypothetical protein
MIVDFPSIPHSSLAVIHGRPKLIYKWIIKFSNYAINHAHAYMLETIPMHDR